MGLFQRELSFIVFGKMTVDVRHRRPRACRRAYQAQVTGYQANCSAYLTSDAEQAPFLSYLPHVFLRAGGWVKNSRYLN